MEPAAARPNRHRSVPLPTPHSQYVYSVLVSTPAIILHAFPYGETSKILRLATRDHGVQSVIAKGALRPRSRFSAGLQALSEGVAQFSLRPNRELFTLTGFDLANPHASLARELPRFAAAAALAELVLRFAESEPQPDIFDALAEGLEALCRSSRDRAPYTALAVLWRQVALLGFAPTVGGCVRCGKDLAERAAFSLPEGGLLCARCGGNVGGTLDPDDRRALAEFVAGSDDVPSLPANHVAAHRRLFVRFVQRHLADDRPMPALALWERLP